MSKAEKSYYPYLAKVEVVSSNLIARSNFSLIFFHYLLDAWRFQRWVYVTPPDHGVEPAISAHTASAAREPAWPSALPAQRTSTADVAAVSSSRGAARARA